MLPRLTPNIPHVSMTVALLNFKLGKDTVNTNQFHPHNDPTAVDSSDVITASVTLNPKLAPVIMRIKMGAYDSYMENLSVNQKAQLLTGIIEQELSTIH